MMLATNTERPMWTWPQLSMQDIPGSLLHEQLLEQAIENSLNCAVHPSYKSVPTTQSNPFMDGSSLASDEEVGNINKFPGNRKLSIILIPAIKSSPQINLLIASPSSVQSYHQPLKKDRRKLHTTWVRKLRRRVDCQSPRSVMQPSQERLIVSTEDAQVDSSKHCLIGSQAKEEVRTLQASRKRKREEQESSLHLDQPPAKRRYVITEEESQPDISEKIIDKQIGDPTSKASILPQASSSASATAHSSGKPSTFSIDDINTGATILTLITEICNNADRKFSRLEQLDLLDLFKQMPDLMTREQRLSGDSRKMANDFVSTVYQSCGAANWGEIETFDDLKLKLEALTKFDSRAEASPRQEGHIIVL
ncbi:Ff.00g027000.m01.CDS01 [Fusarium sp. VM40]|nr:Ff.00g027000.m01.CDS01 [Fusarium sp. VM40]